MTLHRFYSLHYTLPFIIFAVSMIHFALLHEFGSNNPLGVSTELDNAPFMPYYGIKDAFSIFVALFIFFLFVFFYPDKLGHSDNYIMANSLVTPPHIVPE
jgi:quinol-cytochrome oxidoreductase complex cytochrome b subunit